MNTKLTLTALAAAATLAIGGIAMGQVNPPTSTPGAGCTATGNAMKGGNLGGSPTNKDCGPGTTAATTGAVVTPAAPAAASTAPADTGSTASAAPAGTAPMASGPTGAKVARADRN
jgi:hypothetical protein